MASENDRYKPRIRIRKAISLDNGTVLKQFITSNEHLEIS